MNFLSEYGVTLLYVTASVLAVILSFVGLRFKDNQGFTLAQSIVENVVKGVEQANPALKGADKKRLAEQLIVAALKDAHVNIPVVLIDSLIEAAVLVLPKFFDYQVGEILPAPTAPTDVTEAPPLS